jgi:hypothetical protein
LRRTGVIIADGRIIAARPAARVARGERAIPQGIGAMRFASLIAWTNAHATC